MQNVPCKLGSKTVFVSFISRYRGENDFRIQLTGDNYNVSGRISRNDSGEITRVDSPFTLREAEVALDAYDKAEAADYAAWRAANAHLFAPQGDSA